MKTHSYDKKKNKILFFFFAFSPLIRNFANKLAKMLSLTRIFAG